MKSTDYNLNNPMSIDSIGLQKVYDAWKNPTVQDVTKEYYDLLQTKDPHTIYVITDVYPVRVYYGDLLVSSGDVGVKYVMGPSDKYGEYVIYMWRKYNFQDTMIEVCRYNDQQKAVDALNKYNKVGAHDAISNSVYEILNSYIDEEISIHNMIMGIIAAFGFKDDPRFNELNSKFMPYGMINNNPFRDIPIIAVEMIKRRAENDKDSLFKYYYGVYNEVFIYNFFKGEKYKNYTDMRDLSEEVQRICKVFIMDIPLGI